MKGNLRDSAHQTSPLPLPICKAGSSNTKVDLAGRLAASLSLSGRDELSCLLLLSTYRTNSLSECPQSRKKECYCHSGLVTQEELGHQQVAMKEWHRY